MLNMLVWFADIKDVECFKLLAGKTFYRTKYKHVFETTASIKNRVKLITQLLQAVQTKQ